MPDRCGLLVYFVFGQNPETESGCIYLTLNLFLSSPSRSYGLRFLTLSRGDIMKNSVLMFSLLSGTSLVFPDLSVASGMLTHKLTDTPKPEPVFSFEQLDKAFKTASVCFLGYGDCDNEVAYGKGNEDYTIDTAAQCKNEGFVLNNCNSVQVPEGVCPYNKSYITRCKCATNLVTCPAGQVGVGESCGGKYASCKCDPKLVSCASNQVGQGASCGGRYQSCSCKSEYIYNSSNCKSPRSLSGSSCGGKYTGCSCPSGVSSGSFGCEEYYPSPCSSVCKKAKSDNCDNRTAVSTPYGCAEYWSDCSSKCKTAYNDNCRNRVAVTCQFGCASYFGDCQSKCQTCKGDNCGSRTAVISSCPANATCSYFSDCSSKISSWSCKSGYKKSGNSCVKDNPCDNRTAVSVPANAYCSSYYSDCSSKCSAWNCSSGYTKSGNSCIKVDTCDKYTNKSCSYGCQTYYSDCTSKCQTCYSDNCRNRTAVSVPSNATCSAKFSDCSSKCSEWKCNSGYTQSGSMCVKNDPCDSRTNQSCTYGCKTYWSDCSSKCQVCYTDNCRNRTAVSVPSNASCTDYYSDCSSKCSSWTCNSGYIKSGNSCVKDEPEPSPSSSPSPSPSEPTTPTAPTEAECRRRYPDFDECADRGPCTCDRRRVAMPGDCSAYSRKYYICASW